MRLQPVEIPPLFLPFPNSKNTAHRYLRQISIKKSQIADNKNLRQTLKAGMFHQSSIPIFDDHLY